MCTIQIVSTAHYSLKTGSLTMMSMGMMDGYGTFQGQGSGLGVSDCPGQLLVNLSMTWHVGPPPTTKLAIIKWANNNKCWWGCRKIKTLIHCWQQCKVVQQLWRSLAVLHNAKYRVRNSSSSSRYRLKSNKNLCSHKNGIWIFI